MRSVRAALGVCTTRASLRRTAAIALVVGSAITAVNQGDVIVAGASGVGLAAKVPLNFLIPFLSSNLGVLTYARARG